MLPPDTYVAPFTRVAGKPGKPRSAVAPDLRRRQRCAGKPVGRVGDERKLVVPELAEKRYLSVSKAMTEV